MKKHFLLATVFSSVVLYATAAYSQFPAAQGVDSKNSIGVFRIQVADKFAPFMAGCDGYDGTTKTFTSPVLFDGNTTIGRSNPLKEGDATDQTGVSVGAAGSTVTVGDNILVPPAGFAAPAAGTREVHTEIQKLNLHNFRKETAANVGGGLDVRVRAGVCYNDPTCSAATPGRLSPGEVVSNSGSGNPGQDFPARSFFDVYVQIDIPVCGSGGFPGATFYNQAPLIIQNPNLQSLPPDVIYKHDVSTSVPLLFNDASPGKWNQNEMLGYVMLAGHGFGDTQGAQANMAAFKAAVIPPNPIVPPPLCPPCEKKDGGPTFISFAVLAGLLAIFSVVAFIRRRRAGNDYSV